MKTHTISVLLALASAAIAGAAAAVHAAEAPRYTLDLWQHPWAVARWNKVEPFSPEHYKAMEPLWKTLAECGVRTLTTTIIDLPWNHQCYDGYYSMIKRERLPEGGWRFDYGIFDEYVEFGRRCGIGPDIACYTMCPWSSKVKPGSKEFEDYWGAFIVDFAAHLKAKGWFENTYIAMDERAPEDVRTIANFIRERAPGFKIAMAGDRKPSDFHGIVIDSYSQVLPHVSEAFLKEAAERRAKGYRTTFYVCCWPKRPNTFTASEKEEAYWLGVYPALSGLDGFLRWAANSWPADPFKDPSFGKWPAGDTFLIYPDGTLTPAMKELAEGIRDANRLAELNRDGSLGAKLADFKARYGHAAAEKGEFDFKKFKSEIKSLLQN